MEKEKGTTGMQSLRKFSKITGNLQQSWQQFRSPASWSSARTKCSLLLSLHLSMVLSGAEPNFSWASYIALKTSQSKKIEWINILSKSVTHWALPASLLCWACLAYELAILVSAESWWLQTRLPEAYVVQGMQWHTEAWDAWAEFLTLNWSMWHWANHFTPLHFACLHDLD